MDRLLARLIPEQPDTSIPARHFEILAGLNSDEIATVTHNGMTITPELRARVVYDVLGDSRDLTATLFDAAIPTPFSVSGLEPNRFGGIIGAGLTLASTTNWQATISYDAEIRGGDVLHTARGGFTWAFLDAHNNTH